MIYSASFFLVTLAVTCAAPFSSQDEVTRHLLSIMKDKISATYQSTPLNEDLLFKVIQELSSKRVDQPLKVSSSLSHMVKAMLQRKKFQDLASKFLGKVMTYELQPSILKQQKLCTGKQCMTTKKIAAKLASTVQLGSVQNHKNSAYHLANTEAEIPEDRARTIIFKDCLGTFSETWAKFLKLNRNFGSQDSKAELIYQFIQTLAEGFFKFAESNDLLEAIKTFVTSYVRLIIDSEDLVGNVQVIPDWRSLIDFIKKTGRNLIKPTVSNLIKDKDSRKVFRHVVDLASVLLNAEDSSALYPSINFFSQLVDGTKLSNEVKNEFKKTIKNSLFILFKTLRGKDPSREEKLTFLDSFIRLLVSRYNFGTNALVPLLLDQFDYFFTHGDVKRELGPELQTLIFQLLQSVGKDLINTTDGFPLNYVGLDRCINGLLDAINTNFTDFPDVPNGRAASEDRNNEVTFSPREFALKERFSVPLWDDLKYRKN